MKNTILVSAATAFVTTFLVLFTVAMAKGHGCNSHCGGQDKGTCKEQRMSHGCKGESNGHGHGGCHKMKKKKCKSACGGGESFDEEVEIEKKVIIKKVEEE